MEDHALVLILRQKDEIEEQKSEIKILKDSNINLQELYRNEREKVQKAKQKVIDIFKAEKEAKSAAIKEFAEELKRRLIAGGIFPVLVKNEIGNLVKEMTEGKQDAVQNTTGGED